MAMMNHPELPAEELYQTMVLSAQFFTVDTRVVFLYLVNTKHILFLVSR